jgi:hypothetical protein
LTLAPLDGDYFALTAEAREPLIAAPAPSVM